MSKLSEMMDNLSPACDEGGHPITQRQWDELRKQLEQAHADIAGLHDQLEEPQIVQEDYRLNKIELEESRQHVTLLRQQVTLLREPLLYIDEVAKTSKTIISVAAAAMKMLKRIRAALAATDPKEYRGVHVAKEQ